MATIITYDLPSKHREVKAAMFAMGYVDKFLDGANKSVHLPNTTLYHANKLPHNALTDLKAACVQASTQLERCISTQLSSDWTGILGVPF